MTDAEGLQPGRRVGTGAPSPGRRVRIGFKTSPQEVDWATLDATWALAGTFEVLESGWLNDHLSHPARERGGASLEAFTLLATLAHHVPGRQLGHLVLSNTFRHPAVLAKAAAVMDEATGGRFVIGLGAGWHLGEHEAFGIELPPVRERFDRFESALRIIRAMGSSEATEAGGSGVDLAAPPWALRGASNLPPPIRAGGPELWLGVRRPRGLRLVARYADGWNDNAAAEGDTPERFGAMRDEIRRECDRLGRDPGTISCSVQLDAGGDAASRREAVQAGLAFARAGADHLILAVPARPGPAALEIAVQEVAVPLREALG